MLKQVAAGVFVHQSELLQNNTVVVHSESGAFLVDPGITSDEMACLAHDLRDQGRSAVAGFATHPDWDHVLWQADLGEAPRYGTADCARFMWEVLAEPDWRTTVAEGLPEEIADEIPLDLFGIITALHPGASQIPWDGPQIRIVEHPAHAEGHAALLIEESGVLVAGDMLSDILVPFPDMSADDPVGDYLIGLQRLEDLAGGVEVVIPGHGSVGRAAEIRVRIDLDREYMTSLRDGHDVDDPRIGPSATFGRDWLPGIYEWQREQLEVRQRGI